MRMPIQSGVQVGHETSLDVARARQTTIQEFSTKRSHQQFQAGQGPILSDTTNQARPVGFVRSSFPSSERQIHASSIFASTPLLSQPGISEYSQRREIPATPSVDKDPRLSLAHPDYGLPEQLVNNFAAHGIKSIYPWQSKCLLAKSIINGTKNLVYTAPTGGGKSLVADVLMLKKIIDNPAKKAILVLPYVALVQEKMQWLRSVVEGVPRQIAAAALHNDRPAWWKRGDENSIRVLGFFAGSRSRASWADMDIAVCTIEKANALVNTAIEDCTVNGLGVVVMDELHMIDDDHRGYLMELMATKLLSLEQDIQIVGMSATLSNTELLATWLGGKYYVSNYRPIPIEEHLVFENSIFPAVTSRQFFKTATQLNSQETSTNAMAPKPTRTVQVSQFQELSNPVLNVVVALASETVGAGYSALVFCSSRSRCEADALLISQALPQPYKLLDDVIERRHEVMNDLRNTTTGLDSHLEKTIPRGVGFHHAGLTTEEREIVTRAYDAGVLKVMVATCSLAAGINLPARRVILHGARMGPDLVGPAMLQMRGRAGRKGKDEIGETYLCCEKQDLEEVATLMEAELPKVTSCLSEEKRGIERALLEIISTGLATSQYTLQDYLRKSLVYHTSNQEHLTNLAKSTIDNLAAQELITIDSTSAYSPTPLGQAIVASAFSPSDGLFVHSELRKAVQGFDMEGDLHSLYTFTPIHSHDFEVNWQTFRKEIEALDETGFRVLKFVGISPAKINKLAHGTPATTLLSPTSLRIHQRFYLALQLRDLCSEIPIHVVARKYNIARGAVQNLAQTCQGFAAGIIKFCKRMGWAALAAALDHMSDRLRAGAKADLLQLAQVTFIKSHTARVFWENGFKTVGALAAANVADIMRVLLQAQPKKIWLDEEDQRRYDQKVRLKAEVISKSAARIWERLMQQEIDEE